MNRHPFEPAAAVAGLVVVAVAAVVATFGVERTDPVLAVAGGAAALGLLVIPWRRRPDDAVPEAPGTAGET